jgi:RNA polymerase sigma-70 factor (ECF subfamily)
MRFRQIRWNLLFPSTHLYVEEEGGVPVDERGLIKRARRGDAGAFTALVKRYERPMYATACSMLHSEWDAADAVQEAFTEAFEHLDELRNPERFKAWLSRIVINKCNHAYRTSARLLVVEQPPERPTPAGPVSREESFDLIRAVRKLDDDYRATVALRYFCDLKIDEVAQILGCPVGTVKSRLNRALAKLHMTLGARSTGSARSNVQEVAR